MADTSPAAAEATEADISEVLAEKLRDQLSGVMAAYARYYTDDDYYHEGDSLVSYIQVSDSELLFSGIHDGASGCCTDHRLQKGKFVKTNYLEEIPEEEDIQDLLKSFWEVVKNQIINKMMFYKVVFDTSDGGRSWTLIVFKDDDDWEGVTFSLGSIRADF